MGGVLEPGFFLANPDKVRQLLLVTPDLLPQVWPQVEHLFLENASIWDDYYTLDSFPPLFYEGTLQLWTMNDEEEFLLVMVTEIRTFPKVKVLNLLILVGREFKDALSFLDYVELWANKQGAIKSAGVGRKGILRILKSCGYKEHKVTFEKDISGIVEH